MRCFLRIGLFCAVLAIAGTVSGEAPPAPAKASPASGESPPVAPYERADWPIRQNALDAVVLPVIEAHGGTLAKPSSDETFIRRVYIDMLGTVPEPGETEAFVADTRSDKRSRLVDGLFLRDEYADYTSLKWGDRLRIKSEFPINLWPNAVQAYSRWVEQAVRSNMPYDEFARALLTASGSNFRQPPANFYRAMEAKNAATIARTVALTWLALPLESLPQQAQTDFTAFFSCVGYKKTGEWKEEIVTVAPLAAPTVMRFPDGSSVSLAAGADPRAAFADWLVKPGNPWFARAEANRIWASLMGHGIAENVDDVGSAPSPVLDLLAKTLVSSKYDLRSVYRLILNSRTYQQSSLQIDADPRMADCLWARYAIRRLDAEVLIDALDRIGGSGEAYYSPIPEPFTFVPTTNRTISLADGSISSSFLARFGRPSRDSGKASERATDVNEEQLRYLLNSSDIRKKIEQSPRLKTALALPSSKRAEQVTELYRQILSRPPTAEESAAAVELLKKSTLTARQAATDLAWALVNGKEFLYRH